MNRSTVGALLLLPLIVFVACASWPKHGIVLNPPTKLRVAVLPVRFDVRIRALKEIENPPAPPLPREKELGEIQSRTHDLISAMTESLEERLKASYFFEPVGHEDVNKALSEANISSVTVLSTATFSSLGERISADAFLRVTVLGYGRIKRRWIFLLLASGLAEGTAQGVIVAEAAGSVPAAIGVAAEELLQETAEDVGGVLFFNQFFTPVILKAELISAKDGKIVWRRWALASKNRQAVKKLPASERAKKDVRLKLVFEQARDKLVKSLEKKALKNESSVSSTVTNSP